MNQRTVFVIDCEVCGFVGTAEDSKYATQESVLETARKHQTTHRSYTKVGVLVLEAKALVLTPESIAAFSKAPEPTRPRGPDCPHCGFSDCLCGLA